MLDELSVSQIDSICFKIFDVIGFAVLSDLDYLARALDQSLLFAVQFDPVA